MVVIGHLQAVQCSLWSLQAVYSSLQSVHGKLVQSLESLQAVYCSLVQPRVDYSQSTAILCSLWAVYRQSMVL